MLLFVTARFLATMGGGDAQFLFQAMNFDTLKLKKIEEPGLFSGTRVISRKDPSGGSLSTGFRDGSFALQVKIVQKFLSVGGEVVHAEEDGALLHIDIVARGPFHFGERRIGAIPLAAGVGRAKRADARIGAAIAEGFIETADGVVLGGDGEKIVGGPAVVKTLGPD